MSFAAAVDHLHALGQELAAPTAARRKFDLDHMRILALALGDPQTSFPAVLIAGTNGKGSTAATLASILSAAGYRTGLYTSPHLTRVTERIRISQTAPPTRLSFRTLSEVEGEESAFQPATDNLQPATFLEIPEADFARLYFRIDDVARQLVDSGDLPHHPSFFETLTALAFLYFAGEQTADATREPVDIAILEVGLGGRLDATNIVEPILSVITDIALDHQEYLGDTIAAIAREKAGILRPEGTLITLPQHPEANQAIGEAAIALNVRAINAADYLPGRNFAAPIRVPQVRPQVDPGNTSESVILSGARSELNPPPSESVILSGARSAQSKDLRLLPPNHYDLTLSGETLHIRSPLAGQHQQRNIALAIAAAVELRNNYSNKLAANPALRNIKSYNTTNSAIEAGIASTSWPGRLEFLPPNLLLDVAHNPAGAWTLRAAIASLPEDLPRTLIFSCLRDKDLTEMAQILFPLFDSTSDRPRDHLILTPIHNPRAASLEDLLAAARKLDIPAHTAEGPAEALALARSLTPANGLILATGSIYLIGALREAVLNQ